MAGDRATHARDAADFGLGLSDRILYALQGHLPQPESGGARYVRIPANRC